MAESSFLTAVQRFLAGPANLAPAPGAVGIAEPLAAGELPAIVLSLERTERAAAGLGVRGELVVGALPVRATMDVGNAVLPGDPPLTLLDGSRRRLTLPQGGLVRADGSEGTLAAADLAVRVAGAPRAVVAGAPGPNDVQSDAARGVLFFGAALPAAGEVVVDYHLGQWEREIVRIAGVLRIDVCAAAAPAAQALSDAVLTALLGRDVQEQIQRLVTLVVAGVGSIGPIEEEFADCRRRVLRFAFEFEHRVDRPESSGGVIREVSVTVRTGLPPVEVDGTRVT